MKPLSTISAATSPCITTKGLSIGLSRVELRVHYLTDVFAGWSLGAAVFALCGVAGLVVARVRHTNLARS